MPKLKTFDSIIEQTLNTAYYMNITEHITRVVNRTRAFYNHASEPGHFLVNVDVPAACPEIPPLYEFDLEKQLHQWLDCKLAAQRPLWHAKEDLDDDTIPSICPHFGIAEHSAWLGTDVQLQHDTCLPVPIIREPADLKKLRCSEQTPWFRYMKSGYEYLHRQKDGTFVLSVRGTMTPMDIAEAIRGNELFTDLLLQPEFCHELMDWLVQAIRWYYQHLVSWADPVEKGYVFMFGSNWMPANTLGHISNDAAMLCSAEIYKQFGFPYELRLVEPFDAVLYHVHNEKLHFVPQLVELPHLAMLEISTDPKTTPPVENMQQVSGITGATNLMLHAASDQIRKHIDELKERNVYFRVACRDRKDAEDIIALVRDRSKPLE